MSQDPHPLEDFRGTARLFPLPNLVLFPHVAQPLHIFEPRYREMMADSLEDDRLLGMALLRPGWEEDYHKRPPIYPMICLGRITQEERLADGRYNLLLQGLCRARVIEEVKFPRSYRLARVQLCPDQYLESPQQQHLLRQQLRQAILPFFAPHPSALEQLHRLLESSLPLGTLCDIFAFALPLEIEPKQQLLEEVHVEPRVRLLLAHLQESKPADASPPKRRFPPDFSAN